MISPRLLVFAAASFLAASTANANDWSVFPGHFSGMTVDEADEVTLKSGEWNAEEKRPFQWCYALAEELNPSGDVQVRATFMIEEPGTERGFFGKHWSVWPDLTFGDEGFDAGIVFRFRETDEKPGTCGYRVQVSQHYGQLALVRFPEGGYLRSVPCELTPGKTHALEVEARGAEIVVRLDGEEKIRLLDHEMGPVSQAGKSGLGVSSRARVKFSEIEWGKPKKGSSLRSSPIG